MARAATAKRKVTLLLSEQTATRIRQAVDSGAAASQSELVERAVKDFLRLSRQERLRREYEAAARDPRFLSDIEDVMHDFEPADREAERMIRG